MNKLSVEGRQIQMSQMGRSTHFAYIMLTCSLLLKARLGQTFVVEA